MLIKLVVLIFITACSYSNYKYKNYPYPVKKEDIVKVGEIAFDFAKYKYEYEKFSYYGNISDHMPLGTGNIEWFDGAKYVGDFLNGIFHGKGKITTKEGIIFDGTFSYGQLVKGWMQYPDGSKYFGYYKNYRKHGDGFLTTSDGMFYLGEFQDGEFHGSGQVYDSNTGDYYEGFFEDGNKSGEGFYKQGDLISSIVYENGKDVTTKYYIELSESELKDQLKQELADIEEPLGRLVQELTDYEKNAENLKNEKNKAMNASASVKTRDEMISYCGERTDKGWNFSDLNTEDDEKFRLHHDAYYFFLWFPKKQISITISPNYVKPKEERLEIYKGIKIYASDNSSKRIPDYVIDFVKLYIDECTLWSANPNNYTPSRKLYYKNKIKEIDRKKEKYLAQQKARADKEQQVQRKKEEKRKQWLLNLENESIRRAELIKSQREEEFRKAIEQRMIQCKTTAKPLCHCFGISPNVDGGTCIK